MCPLFVWNSSFIAHTEREREAQRFKSVFHARWHKLSLRHQLLFYGYHHPIYLLFSLRKLLFFHFIAFENELTNPPHHLPYNDKKDRHQQLLIPVYGRYEKRRRQKKFFFSPKNFNKTENLLFFFVFHFCYFNCIKVITIITVTINAINS